MKLKPLNCIISHEKCINLTVHPYPKKGKIEKKIKNILRNDEKNKLTDAALFRAIEATCDGLIYISETDSPVKAVFVSKNDTGNIEDTILVLAGPQPSEILERSADAFFSRLILDREWHSEKEKARVRRFRNLKDLLQTNLISLRQFRIGTTRVTIFVIGVDDAGNIAGITTDAVET